MVLDPANSEPDASTHQHCLVRDLHWTSSNFPSGLHSGAGIIEPWERSCWAWQAVDCIPVMAIYCLSYQALWSGIQSLVVPKCFGSGLQTCFLDLSKLEFLYVTLYHLIKQMSRVTLIIWMFSSELLMYELWMYDVRNHDSNGNKNIAWKYKFTLLVLVCDHSNLFNWYNVAELPSKRTGGNCIQFETENESNYHHVLTFSTKLWIWRFRCFLAEVSEEMHQHF